MEVYKECCKNCLLTPDRIVSSKRMTEILQTCAKKQSYFICHKASQDGKDVCCRNFYDRLGYRSQMIRIAERLGVLKFVPQTDSKKLPTWEEMKKKPSKRKQENDPRYSCCGIELTKQDIERGRCPNPDCQENL